MALLQIDLTPALRPTLQPNESLLFVQDAVGLYRGKEKLSGYQNGQTYLTTHRACYVDNLEPRKRCVAIDLKQVDRAELVARFLKSSPKVTLLPKLPKLGITANVQSRTAEASPSPPRSKSVVTWICKICSFSNLIPVYFDPATASESTPLQPCQNCGIKPSLAHLLKASIASVTADRGLQSLEDAKPSLPLSSLPLSDMDSSSSGSSFQCPRCTFQNHPSLLSCEMCGAFLLKKPSKQVDNPFSGLRSSSPVLQSVNGPSVDVTDPIKISFRAGGEKIFYERLKGALQQRKWLSHSAPPAPMTSNPTMNTSGTGNKTIGIAGLEQRGLELRKNNEVVIGNAFEDLEALMTSAKELVALAEQLAKHTKAASNIDVNNSSLSPDDPSTLLSQLNLTTTKEMLSNSATNNSLYLTELARSLAEYLSDDVKGILRSEGGIISLVDLWAVYNRARGGVELVSPTDFVAATGLFEKLNLPVRRRQFKSGLLAIQERSRTEEKVTASIVAWVKSFRHMPPDRPVPWDWREWGRGITAQDAAEQFGWSVGVAEEELCAAEESGALCRDSSVEGIYFWENWLPKMDS